jgi:sarcosine oxidase subunit delta
MRIQCPFCGARDSIEFTYLGDAHSCRPDPRSVDAASRFYETVYLRSSPAGRHTELWYHAFGCRGWLRVTRDTCSHEIERVELASDSSAEPGAHD